MQVPHILQMAAHFIDKVSQVVKNQEVLDIVNGLGRADWVNLEHKFNAKILELQEIGRPSFFHNGDKRGLTQQRIFKIGSTYEIQMLLPKNTGSAQSLAISSNVLIFETFTSAALY